MKTLRTSLGCSLLFCHIIGMGISPTFADLYMVETDSSWKSYSSKSDVPDTPNWNQLGYDDSHWRDAYEDYSTHPDTDLYPELSDAKTIWDWPYSGTPTGDNGHNAAYFRKAIYLDNAVENVQLSYAVDDAMVLYINGESAYTHIGAGNTNTPGYKPLDDSLFTVGKNIIAFKAWDGSSSGIWNRGGEALTANLTIETVPVPVPAPAAVVLGLLGLGAAGAKFRRRREPR